MQPKKHIRTCKLPEHEKNNTSKRSPYENTFLCIPCIRGGRFKLSAKSNVVPRARVPFGQHEDTEFWNNQFPETKILGLPASRGMRGMV